MLADKNTIASKYRKSKGLTRTTINLSVFMRMLNEHGYNMFFLNSTLVIYEYVENAISIHRIKGQ